MSFAITEQIPLIYTTGAYLCPVKITDVYGKECWKWTVFQFEEDSFADGKIVELKEESSNLDGLITKSTTSS
ncbi:MAG: hypothetical protein Pg6A_18380 [Termitinemataceae bacterium]|nr:MAG: hypothetical protein Pg6A_18380 [Termitinemataceae bacterium]